MSETPEYKFPTPLELFEATKLDLEPLFAKIEEQLVKQYKLGNSVWVDVPPLGRYERAIITQALKQSGWNCKYSDDQREGTFLTITAITEPVYFKEGPQT